MGVILMLPRGTGLNLPSATRTVPLVLHRYNDPAVSLGSVVVRLVYAIPKNKQDDLDPAWQGKLQQIMQEVSRFHELEFRGASHFAYRIYPEPVILEGDSTSYDTNKTDRGNPFGLVHVSEELERRVFTPGGDQYQADFATTKPGEYRVLGIVYEGVGGSGGIIYDTKLKTPADIAAALNVPASIIYEVQVGSADGFFLLNRRILTDAEYQTYRSSLLYHELAHTFGLADRFDPASDTPATDDLMGAGRYEPLTSGYLDYETLHAMGL